MLSGDEEDDNFVEKGISNFVAYFTSILLVFDKKKLLKNLKAAKGCFVYSPSLISCVPVLVV